MYLIDTITYNNIILTFVLISSTIFDTNKGDFFKLFLVNYLFRDFCQRKFLILLSILHLWVLEPNHKPFPGKCTFQRGLTQSAVDMLLCKGRVQIIAVHTSAWYTYQLSTNTGELYILIGDRQSVWYKYTAAAV